MEWRAAVDLEEASHILFYRWPKSTIPIIIGFVFLSAAYFGYIYTRDISISGIGVVIALFAFIYYWLSVGKLAIKIAMPNETLVIEGDDKKLQEFYWLLEAAWISHRPSRKKEEHVTDPNRTTAGEKPPLQESPDD